jgi:hypothetical protein
MFATIYAYWVNRYKMLLQWIDETVEYHVNLQVSSNNALQAKPGCVYLTLQEDPNDGPSMKITGCTVTLYQSDFVCEFSTSRVENLVGSYGGEKPKGRAAKGVKLEKELNKDALIVKVSGQSLVTCPAGHTTFAYLACDSKRFV